MADPAIIVVSEDNADLLLGEFRSRYQRDYDLRPATTAAQAEDLAREIGGAGGQVAMFVTDSRLPDVDHIFAAIHRWRVVVPTARRVIAAHWDHFLEDGPGLRIGMAKGKYDAYLLMPRGRRDEEFHHAITDLLSDWTSTVPQPEEGRCWNRPWESRSPWSRFRSSDSCSAVAIATTQPTLGMFACWPSAMITAAFATCSPRRVID